MYGRKNALRALKTHLVLSICSRELENTFHKSKKEGMSPGKALSRGNRISKMRRRAVWIFRTIP